MSRPASRTGANQLRKMIVSGELPPGTMVTEAQLSKMLGCSRTPLREALKELSHQYLVVIAPQRGIMIPQLSIVDYRQLCEAQLLFGGESAELAAERISERQLEQLKDVISDQERWNNEGDFYNLAESDWRFHVLIAEASGNRYFTDFAKLVHAALSRFICPAYETVGSFEPSMAEHEEIVEALERRDGDMAKLKMRKHVAEATQRVLNILGGGDWTERS